MACAPFTLEDRRGTRPATLCRTTLVWRQQKRLIFALLASCCWATVALERRADACSPPLCWAAGYSPEDGARAPANLPAIFWRPLRSGGVGTDSDQAKVTLTELPSDEPIALTPTKLTSGSYELQPARTLTSGAQYRLEDANLCDGMGDPRQVTFTATAEVELPDTLGQLSATPEGLGPLKVATASGSCETTIQADRILIELVPSPAALPWIDALHFTTEVDGQVWAAAASIVAMHPPGASWIGRGRDRLFSLCEAEDPIPLEGLPSGEHVVVVKATLPGRDLALQSAPITVSLSCEQRADGGPKDSGPGVDRGSADGPLQSDSGATAAGDPGPTGRSGCDCRVGDARGSGTGLALLLVLLIARRRATRSAGIPVRQGHT